MTLFSQANMNPFMPDLFLLWTSSIGFCSSRIATTLSLLCLQAIMNPLLPLTSVLAKSILCSSAFSSKIGTTLSQLFLHAFMKGL
eukprot:01284.XXX_1858_2112_1 [CDS] Oithona nana genome sequencing.